MSKNHLLDYVRKPSQADLDALPARERKVIQQYQDRLPISRDTNTEFDTHLTFGQRLADNVAKFGGSWTFLILFASLLLAWVLLNSNILAQRNTAFDPYPYILLNLFLSMLASVQAPIILMFSAAPISQRQAGCRT